MTDKNLLNTASRLGLNDPMGLKKSEEFLRTLHSKGSVKMISEVAKTVLCLDLAANFLGLGFDRETAFKLSGLRKSHYQNYLNIIEKILNLDRPKTVNELCVQLQCTAVKATAELILVKYKELDNKIKDISHPQYVAAAIHTACSLKNVKVDKSVLIQTSRLKRAQWKELTSEFEKFAQSLGLSTEAKKREPSTKQEISDNVAEKLPVKKKEEELIEEYEVWKERILREAYAQMKA